ncbi:sulfatase-like hydrolase/transferase [Candidatus Sumerlaeota bacterium]|nr:sulfatase-like hydrolase/transferase [Candidatus Sumerlaeota bacterium]
MAKRGNSSRWKIGALIVAIGCTAAVIGMRARAIPRRPPEVPDPFNYSFGKLKFGLGEVKIFVQGDSFCGEGAERELSVPATGEYFYEFIPVIHCEPDELLDLETHIISADKDSLARTDKVGSELSKAFSNDARFDRIKNPVRVDLTRYRGKRIKMHWVLRPVKDRRWGAIVHGRIAPKHADANPHPHILLICSDTHRFDYSIGDKGPKLMPRLQEFRKEAVTYINAHSNGSWTIPSMASTLTGLFPRFHRVGLRLESGGKARTGGPEVRASGFPPDLTAFTEVLRQNGYTTSLIYANPLLFTYGMALEGEDYTLGMGLKKGDALNAQAAKLIDALPADRPQCLMVHYLDVHQWREWYFDERHKPEDPFFSTKEKVIACYEDAARDSDRYLGDLLDLWRKKFGEDGLIVFFADHGDHLFDPGYPQLNPDELAKRIKVYQTEYPLLNHGNSMEEVLLHVPLVTRYPAGLGVQPGDDVRDAALVDLFPTLMEAAGIKPDGLKLSGRSLLQMPTPPEADPRVSFADFQFYGDELSSARQGAFKLVVNHTQGKRELFDLRLSQKELGEQDQLSRDEGTYKKMSGAFDLYVRDSESETSGTQPHEVKYGRDDIEAMKALGYLK